MAVQQFISAPPKTFTTWLVIFIVTFSISLSIVHTSINTVDETHLGGLTDSLAYVNSYYGKEVMGHWRYRVLTIGLARLVPNQLELLLQRDPTPYRRAHIHFAVVNLCFLTATAMLLYAYLMTFFAEKQLALLGAVIFLTSRVNVQSGGAPMVDPSSFFFLLLGMYAIIRRNTWMLFISCTLGVFAKETTLLLWPMLWLADLQWRRKGLYSLVLLPGTAAYMVFRYIIYPDPSGASFFSLELMGGIAGQLHSFLTPNGLVDWISSFNLFWIPAIYALIRLPKPVLIRRWLWMIPIVLAMIILLEGDLGRILFLTFPVVIPLALIGIQHWMSPELSDHPQLISVPIMQQVEGDAKDG
ncbi:MAG: hypothetical protein ACYDEO_00435 [Aggregatilineales bacterium]